MLYSPKIEEELELDDDEFRPKSANSKQRSNILPAPRKIRRSVSICIPSLEIFNIDIQNVEEEKVIIDNNHIKLSSPLAPIEEGPQKINRK